MNRRSFLAIGSAAAGLRARADVPTHLWQGHDFGPGPSAPDRLNQGPFGIEQDNGWFTIASTTPSTAPVRNYGTGLVGYTWEEGGPSLSARRGAETLERHVEKLSGLPFVDVLYIRCDWRNVQKHPGCLELDPVWKLTLDAARRRNLRVAFRVQLSNTVYQPERLAMPDFVQSQVPAVPIGRSDGVQMREPQYHHPAFQKAFAELVELLAREFDGHPQIEFMDLMQYGFWGEGHTSNLPNPFPDYLTAERTSVAMTRRQLEAFRRTPLAVNTQPDISAVGNREVIDMVVRAGGWLRSDSVLLDEPEQIEALSNRPPWLAVVMEDGYFRQYRIDRDYLPVDAAGVTALENTMLHTLDLGANYWSLWTEADNLLRFHERYPDVFPKLRSRLGYRVRPSWVWQRKRYGTDEIVVAFANDGVAGVPGLLRVYLESPDGKFRVSGALDAGHPYAGKLRQASFMLPPGLEGGTLRLRAELETRGVRRPVRWACAQPLEADGSYAIRIKPHTDKDWRKGV
ncbi:MAG TPA: hypothetical protein VN428_25180 [Bryobacteraceae bacterium]|nr:hypothetical protein [Bryobacteraceae bacterium]